MSAKYPHVYEPFEIRGVLFKNRLQQAPPGCFFAGDERGFVTQRFVDTFRQYARGGVAICEVGNCSIDITESSDEPGQLRLDDPDCVQPLKLFAEMCEVDSHGILKSVIKAFHCFGSNVRVFSNDTITFLPGFSYSFTVVHFSKFSVDCLLKFAWCMR